MDNIKSTFSFIREMINKLSFRNKRKFYLGLFIYCIGSLISLSLPYILGEWINQQLKNINFLYLLLFLSFIGVFISNISKVLLNNSGFELVKTIRDIYFKNIISKDLYTIEKEKSGDLSSRITNDISLYFGLISEIIPQLLVTVIKIISTLSILIVLNTKLTLLGICIIPCICLIMAIFNKKISYLSQLKQEKISNISENLVQVRNNIRLVKGYNAEQQEQEHNRILTNEAKNTSIQLSNIELFLPLLLISISLIFLFIIIKNGFSQINSGATNLGAFISFLLYLFQLLDPITQISILYSQVLSVKGSVSTINSTLNCSDKSKVTNKQFTLPSDIETIEFKNVSFSYKNKEILSNISFEVYKGQINTIVGESGIGKSTIFSLLMKFYENYEGDIFINQCNIKDIETTNLRNKIAYVPQENLLFSRSVSENLFYGKNRSSSLTDYTTISKNLHLNFLDKKNGLNTILSENGRNLSEGQKQRLGVARGMLSNSSILLLDESTSHLDPISEKIIIQNLNKMKDDVIVLMISHDKDTIKNSDNIIFLHDKTVELEGSPIELSKISKSYSEFIDS